MVYKILLGINASSSDGAAWQAHATRYNAGMMDHGRTIWFRPKRLWFGFALYYPANWPGAILTTVLMGTGGVIFLHIDTVSHSVSDTLIGFAPWAIALMAVYDLCCFRLGEYPSWWQRSFDRKNIIHNP